MTSMLCRSLICAFGRPSCQAAVSTAMRRRLALGSFNPADVGLYLIGQIDRSACRCPTPARSFAECVLRPGDLPAPHRPSCSRGISTYSHRVSGPLGVVRHCAISCIHSRSLVAHASLALAFSARRLAGVDAGIRCSAVVRVLLFPARTWSSASRWRVSSSR